ncbi:MAG TPA: helix-turn-helix domain-containing protein [Solirubrobacteraceae bacterium]
MRAALLDRSIEHVGVSRVLADAKIPRAVFYQLFVDRDDCVAVVIGEAIETARAQAAQAMDEQTSWARRVRAGLGALLGLFDEERELARLCVIHSRHEASATATLRASALQALVSVIAQGAGENGVGPEPVTAEATVAGVLGVIEANLQARHAVPLVELLGPLMSFIVRPYEGAAAARKQLARGSGSIRSRRPRRKPADLPAGLRVTYRTVRVLGAIAEHPGMTNLQIARCAEIDDQGQVSKLLKRLAALELIENTGKGQAHGQANRWRLRAQGKAVLERIGVGGRRGSAEARDAAL